MDHFLSLSEWARQLGIDRHTIRGYLLAAGVFLPDVGRGSKHLIPTCDIRRALSGRTPQTDLPRLRVERKKAVA